MKQILILLIAISLQSCCPFCDEPVDPESEYEPVFMKRSEFENSVVLQGNKPIDKAGKIYTYENYLFINEKNKGFHVYNNEHPENPIAVKFINSPGATDMAIKNNVIFINQATDLIAVELNNMQSITVTKRIENIFPEMVSPDGYYVNTPQDKVLVNWVKK